jgi:mannitol 2-dehydrogenase
MPALAQRSLPALPATVPAPGYDRAGLRTGIVHLGLGGFARAHLAAYVDRLLGRGTASGWGICGVGLLPGDRRMRDALTAQDGLYTLVVKHPDGSLEPRVIGSVVRYLFAPDDPRAVIDTMAAPDVRIVSLTLTEGGYDPTTAAGDPTAFELVTRALALRRASGLPPFTVLSCDNVPHNGDVARRAFTRYAAGQDPGLAGWLSEHGAFPNSMVDRITPATTDEDRAHLAERFGVDDAWPVVCEPFSQWVLEDVFCEGRPPLEDAGVQLVTDVTPYELMKLRLLNAGHQLLGHVGRLAGLEWVHEACRDPLLRRLLLGYLREEALPTLPPVPGIDLSRYVADLLERFGNPQVRDTLDRICADASARIPKFLLPVLEANLADGGEIRHAVLVLAAWARAAEGTDDAGRPIQLTDSRRERLVAAARDADPLAFVADREVFGGLADDSRFAACFTELRTALAATGVRDTAAPLAG